MLLAGHNVATVTYFATKLTATCSPMTVQFFDTMILALSDIEWWKLFRAKLNSTNQ